MIKASVPANEVREKELLNTLHRLFSVRKISAVPEILCELMAGDACVIWKPSRELTERQISGSQTVNGRLYPYSSNFSGKSAIQHAGIAMETTLDTTGRFYLSGRSSDFENDFRTKDSYSPSEGFMQKQQLRRVCLARFAMLDPMDGTFVAGVYRTQASEPFSSQDALRLENFAAFLPMLYRQLVAPQLRQAVLIVNGILSARCRGMEEARASLSKLCTELGDHFSTREVSVFLRDNIPNHAQYSLVASTLSESEISRKRYGADPGDGLTGYVLARKSTIWFHDLHNFRDPQRLKLITDRYPGMTWSDGAEFGKLAKTIFGLSDSDLNPPLPFIGVPVVGEQGDVLGAIRASLGTNPFYFLSAQIETFEIIAREIGRWWESIMHGAEHMRRADVWEALNKTIIKQHDALKSTNDIQELIEQTVLSISEQPGFDLAVFRRGADQSTLKLVSLHLSPRESVRVSGRDLPKKNDLFPLGISDLKVPDRANSFYVEKIERTSEQLSGDSSGPEQTTFAGLARVISCPVFIERRLYGVLDVGFQSEGDFSNARQRIEQFVELVARQVALFVRTAESVAEVQAAQDNELRTYAIVTHQLKTPLFTATRRLRGLGLVPADKWNANNTRTLAEVSGMVRKARSVTNSIEIFGAMVARQPIKTHPSSAKPESAWTLSLEVARNTRCLSDPRLQVAFQLGEKESWGQGQFRWSASLAEQCLDAVIHNGFKYSAPNETVEITGAFAGSFFVVSVINQGPYRIAVSETDKCKQQGWRGAKAQERDGVGLGLWIADYLMTAQGGELRVHPTTSAGETKIELCFLAKSGN